MKYYGLVVDWDCESHEPVFSGRLLMATDVFSLLIALKFAGLPCGLLGVHEFLGATLELDELEQR